MSVLTIAVIGIPDLRDSDFCDKVIALSQTPAIIGYDWFHTSFFDATPQLEFDWLDPKIYLMTNRQRLPNDLRETLFAHCQGIIVSLAGRGLDVKFWQHPFGYAEDKHVEWMELYLEVIYKLNLPTIFALEDIQDGTSRILVIKSVGSRDEEGRILSFTSATSKEAREILTLEDDIWNPTSVTLKTIRQILKIPDNMPMLPYSHTKPESLQHILKTLLAMIETQT